jgi:Ser/Thr protein kinase RdoA (MazF antagonist)
MRLAAAILLAPAVRRAVVARVGVVRDAGPAGRALVIRGDRGALVLKWMSEDRPADAFGRALDALGRAGVRCPRLLGEIPADGRWLALLSYLPGLPLSVSGAERWASLWRQAVWVLTRIAALPASLAPWDLRQAWLRRLAGRLGAWPAAARLLDRLNAAPPGGAPAPAHGDFAPQNFLDRHGRLAVVDWDDLGMAEPGFDGGWLLALNRIGAGPRMERARLWARLTTCGLPGENLAWFEALGLLRMLHRAATLPLDSCHARHLTARLERALAELIEERQASWRSTFHPPTTLLPERYVQ